MTNPMFSRRSLGALGLAAPLLATGAVAQTPRNLVLGAASPGHATFNIVVAYSRVINRLVPAVATTVQQSGASTQTTQLVQTNRIAAGPTGNSAPYEAWRGLGTWQGRPTRDIRTWMPMYVYGAQLVVREDSPIRSWADLAGRRVGVGSIGSVGEMTNQVILEANGVGYDRIQAFRIPHEQMVDGFRNGNLDAVIVTTGIPSPGILELMAGRRIRIVGNTPEEIANASRRSALLSGGVVPANSYDGIAAEIPIVVGYTIMIIHPGIPDQIVYDMTKAVWENLDEIRTSHASQRFLSPEMIRPSLEPIAPIHDGAARYYRERGWIG
jgi:TRAP transporter TAXI family solute receptor